MSASWDSTDWTGVVALCKRWPVLRVIVSEGRIRREQHVIYRALDACPNLRLELSGLWLHRSIEYITEHWGAERLLFGSDLQDLPIAWGLGPADKRLILGETLRKILRECSLRA